MSGLELAIRNALERSDRSNAEIRARIYQSARQALEAGLRKQEINDPDTVALQRQRLEVTIRQIEGEERARLQAAAAKVEPLVASSDNGKSDNGNNGTNGDNATGEGAFSVPPTVEMDVTGDRREPPAMETDTGFGDMRAERSDRFAAGEPQLTPSRDAGNAMQGGLDVRPETVAHRRRRRTFLPRLFMFSVLLAALGIGIWWVYSSGLLLTTEQRDNSVANPPARVEAEDFDNGQQDGTPGDTTGLRTLGPRNGFSDAWVEAFTPGSTSGATAHSNGAVDLVSGGDGQVARITSRGPDDAGAVEIAIPASLLQEMAGKTSTIALTVQTEADKPTQISVECDFGSLGSCERHRFGVTNEKSDILFQVHFDRSLAPNAPGHLLINSDVEGKGRSVNLYAVRILPGQ